MGKTWKVVTATGEPRGRHETSFVECLGKFYLLGGREAQGLVERFDPSTGAWTSMKAISPLIHHMQPVVFQDRIYMVGSMTGKYPDEPPMDTVHIYDPVEDRWETGDRIPEGRRRGASGTVVYDGKIYCVAGITHGHTSGTNGWFDRYDPARGSWDILPDAPRVRDHFHAIVLDHKLYCIGGRNGSVHEPVFESFFQAVIREIDVYDFKTAAWRTLPPESSLPAGSAAGCVAEMDGKILYFGGETATVATNRCFEFDPSSGVWSELPGLNRGRHGTQAVVHDGKVWVACGSPNVGGGRLTSLEVLSG